MKLISGFNGRKRKTIKPVARKTLIARFAPTRAGVNLGFRSASVLREHFAGIVGTTPVAYRRSFGFARQR
jgi:methylphosphotriester-DNA--protein-cysteine methyltransferase